MTEQSSATTIRIMDREFKVKCPLDQLSDLRDSVRMLDNKVREINTGEKIVNMDRLAIIAALNITHELVMQKRQSYHLL